MISSAARPGESRSYLPTEIEAFYGLPESTRKEDVLLLPPSGRTLQEETYGFHSVWIRLHIPPQVHATEAVLRILPPLFESVEFHQVDDHGNWVDTGRFRIGHAGENGSLDDPMPSFPLGAGAGGSTVLLKLDAINALQASVVLEPRDRALSAVNQQNLLIGGFLGILVALLLYNAVMYRVLRHRFLVHYTGVMLSVALFSTAVHGYLDLWFPNAWVRFGRHIGFLNYLLLITITGFTRSFLMTKRLAPRWDRYHQAIVCVCTIGAVVALTPLDGMLSKWIGPGLDLLSGVQGVLILCTGIWIAARGFEPARYFVLGWSISLLGYAVAFGGVLGYLPMTFFTRFSVQVCSAIEMGVFAVAVGARLQALQRDGLRSAQLASQSGRWKRLVEMAFHDIANPLSVILLHARYAETSGESDERWDVVKRAAYQQTEILEFLRKEHVRSLGEASIDAIQCANVEQVVAELRFLFAARAEKKNVQLRFPSSEQVQGMVVQANALTLANSVFGNLIQNAIKFTCRGGSIDFRVERTANGRIAFIVQDEGVGIPAADLALLESGAVGDRVSRRGTDQEEGSGLGLGIVRAFVQSFGGEMDMESRTGTGSGTRVTVSLLSVGQSPPV